MAISSEPIQPNVKPQSNTKKILIILATVLVVSIVLFYVFNVGGFKNYINRAIDSVTGRENSKEMIQKREIEDALEQISSEKDRILEREAEIDNARASIDIKQKELDDREKELLKREKELDELEEQLSQEIEDIRTVSKLYERMDAEKAADILMEIEDVDTIISILKHIKKDNIADILENMDSKTVATITDRMLE